jgi:hypothetical protein
MQHQRRPTLHLYALALVTRLHPVGLCRLAVRLAWQRCPPPLPTGPGGRPRRYRGESRLLLALLRTLWRLSHQDLPDWLVAWPALALACGLPIDASGRVLVPSTSQLCRRQAQAGAPACECPLVVRVYLAQHWRLSGGRDLIVDSAPFLAWRRRDPNAALGHAPLTRRSMPAPGCWAIGSTRCSCAAAPARRCSSSSPHTKGHAAPFTHPLLA